jgi:hypothetical protein
MNDLLLSLSLQYGNSAAIQKYRRTADNRNLVSENLGMARAAISLAPGVS